MLFNTSGAAYIPSQVFESVYSYFVNCFLSVSRFDLANVSLYSMYVSLNVPMISTHLYPFSDKGS